MNTPYSDIRIIRFCVSLARLLVGIFLYLVFKRNTQLGHQGLIGLFCETRGLSNRVIGFISARYRSRIPLTDRLKSNVLSLKSEANVQKIVSEIESSGFYKHPHLLSSDICDRLEKFARSVEVVGDGSDKGHGYKFACYPANRPSSLIYSVSEEALLNNELIQDLCADSALLAITQGYFRRPPVLNYVTMWWSTSYKDSTHTDIRSAQNWHFDMENPKFLKVFFFLTDVSSKNGAHQYIASSHRSWRLPRALLDRGYSRLPQDVIDDAFCGDEIVTIEGPRGTILIEDTVGLHKGGPVMTGDRLVLQLHYANTGFGSVSSATPIVDFHLKSRKLAQLVRDYPWMYPKIPSLK